MHPTPIVFCSAGTVAYFLASEVQSSVTATTCPVFNMFVVMHCAVVFSAEKPQNAQ